MYAFLVEKAEDRFGVSDDEATPHHARGVARLRRPVELDPRRPRSRRARELHLVHPAHRRAPWNRGRVVIIGDAAHSCPPTIAQGAAQALEDALVLTELLVERDAVDQALWDEFHARRLPRANAVVEASVQLGQWQLDGDRDADAGGLIFGIAQQMAEPA